MKIDVKGAICPNDEQWIYEMFEMESTSPKNISDALGEANGEDVELSINSGGGSVYDASEIYTDLKNYDGHVDIKISGLAGSAASVIAMSSDNVQISPVGQIMIHNAATEAFGGYQEMQAASEMLKSTNQSISNAYRLKTGMEESELLDLMQKETWMSPQVAKEKGFVDDIMFENPNVKLAASANTVNMIPQKVIDGIRNSTLNHMVKNEANFSDDEKKEIRQIAREEVKKQLDEDNDDQKDQQSKPANSWLF